jgi:hypothetical protein
MVWDGDELLAQVDLAGNLVEYWTWASGIGALGVGALGGGGTPSWEALRLVKARIPGSANPDQYLHSDWQGTVLAASGSNGAALTQNYPPRPWGADGPALAPLSWLGNHGITRKRVPGMRGSWRGGCAACGRAGVRLWVPVTTEGRVNSPPVRSISGMGAQTSIDKWGIGGSGMGEGQWPR